MSAKKSLEGRPLKANDFTFTLKDDKGTTIENKPNDVDGNVEFTEIEFTEEGTFTYTITEDSGSLGGVTYDNTVYKAVVVVTDNKQGKLEAALSYFKVTTSDEGETVEVPVAGPEFKNKYVPAPAEAEIEVSKSLTGRELKEGEFTFALRDSDGELVGTASNDAAGVVAFDAVEFDKIGEYTFVVSEVIGVEDQFASLATVS